MWNTRLHWQSVPVKGNKLSTCRLLFYPGWKILAFKIGIAWCEAPEWLIWKPVQVVFPLHGKTLVQEKSPIKTKHSLHTKSTPTITHQKYILCKYHPWVFSAKMGMFLQIWECFLHESVHKRVKKILPCWRMTPFAQCKTSTLPSSNMWHSICL